MSSNFNILNSLAVPMLGQTRLSRLMYKAKYGIYKALRGAPVDVEASKILKAHGIIITNQGAWSSITQAQMHSLSRQLSHLGLSFRTGQELLFSAEKGVSFDAISCAFSYLAMNRVKVSPHSIPVYVRVSKNQDITTTYSWHISQKSLLGSAAVKLSDVVIPTGFTASIQRKMDERGIDLRECHHERTHGSVKVPVSYGYDKRAVRTLTSAPFFSLDEYNNGKYTPLMRLILDDVISNRKSIEVHYCVPKAMEKNLISRGFRVFNFRMIGDRFFEIYLTIKDGQYRYAVCIPDRGRVLHFQKMMKLRGVPENQVSVHSYTNPARQIRQIMKRIAVLTGIKKFDAVVLGNRGTFRRMIITHELIRSHLSDISGVLNDDIVPRWPNDPDFKKRLNHLREKCKRIIDQRAQISRVDINASGMKEYADFETEIEELKRLFPNSKAVQSIPTIIGTFINFKKKFALHKYGDYKKLIDALNAAGQKAHGTSLHTQYRMLAGRLKEIFEIQKKELQEIIGLDPMKLYEDPAYLQNLLRLDEIFASLQSEFPINAVIDNMRIFKSLAEVGKKINTPLFKCQVVTYLDEGGNKKNLLLTDLPYGETAYHLVRHLGDKGTKLFFSSGIAGSLRRASKIEKKQIVAVMELLSPHGKVVKTGNVFSYLLSGKNDVLPVRHAVVDAPYDESEDWIDDAEAKGAQTVDVETYHIARGAAESGAYFGSLNVVSDLVEMPPAGAAEDQTIATQQLKEKRELIDARVRIMHEVIKQLHIAEIPVTLRHPQTAFVDLYSGKITTKCGEFRVTFRHPHKDRERRLDDIVTSVNKCFSKEALSKEISLLEEEYDCIIKTEKMADLEEHR